MRPCFPTYTGRPDKKRTAEGEQKVYVRSTGEGSGDSKKGGGERGPVKSLGPLEATHRYVYRYWPLCALCAYTKRQKFRYVY